MRASKNICFPQVINTKNRIRITLRSAPSNDKRHQANTESIKSWVASQRSSALRGKGKTRHPAAMWSLHTDVTPRCSCCENCRATRVAHKNCT